MDNLTPRQTGISLDTLIQRNDKNQSVSGIDFNISINSGISVRKEYLVQVKP